MADEETDALRYSRQLALDVMGEAGQRRLAASTVVVVGAGALGSNCAELLLRMGVGRVRLVDRDVVELSNLHRIRVLGEADLGRPKAPALAEALQRLLPGCRVEGVAEELLPWNALGLLEGADVALDGLDNMEGRYLLNDACLELGLPWVYAGVVATGGLVAPFPAGGPCLRCLFPEPPEPGLLPTTATAGILPSVPAVAASVEVALACRLLVTGEVPATLLAMDLWSGDWRTVEFSRREGCRACSAGERDFLRPPSDG